MSDSTRLWQPSVMMDALFGATVASLFAGVVWRLGGTKFQLADFLAMLTVFIAFTKGFAAPRVSWLTLIALQAYFLDYLLSAIFVKLSLAGIKSFQLVMILTFLFTLFGYYRTRSADRFLVVSSLLIAAILVSSVGWYVLHGHYVSWKELNEPKTIFTLLPLMLVLLFYKFPRAWRPSWTGLVLFVATLLIFLSGERKAYIFAPVVLLVWGGPRKFARSLLIPLLAAPVFWIATAHDQTGYLHRQVTSLGVLVSASKEQEIPDSQLVGENRPTTLSNAERVFTNRRAEAMWRKEPIFGMGSQAFELKMEEAVEIPSEFRLGIHGEFFRALYENGLIGLGLYIALWLTAFGVVATGWVSERRGPSTLALNKIKLLYLTMVLIYTAFESEKEIMVYALCSLPFVLGLEFLQQVGSPYDTHRAPSLRAVPLA